MQPNNPGNSPQAPAPVYIQNSPVQQPMMYGVPQGVGGQTIVISQSQGNGMATTSLVLGIIGILCYGLGFVVCLTWFVGWLFAILAVIFGHIGHANGSANGTGGQGVAGFLLGYLTLAGYLLPFLLIGSAGI